MGLHMMAYEVQQLKKKKKKVVVESTEKHTKTCFDGFKSIPNKLVLIIIIQLCFEYVLTLIRLCFCVGNLKHLPSKQLYWF